jgi:hypothetical protein
MVPKLFCNCNLATREKERCWCVDQAVPRTNTAIPTTNVLWMGSIKKGTMPGTWNTSMNSSKRRKQTMERCARVQEGKT